MERGVKTTQDHRQGELGYVPREHLRLIQGINRSVIRQSIILIVKLMSFKTSVLIWFSRFRGTASPPANGVGLLCETEEHGS